jgi:hypothetical protein
VLMGIPLYYFLRNRVISTRRPGYDID